MLLFNMASSALASAFSNFNTSNVTIQHGAALEIPYELLDFNTSNVTIQHPIIVFLFYTSIHFNTSNVTIQRIVQAVENINAKFQYI